MKSIYCFMFLIIMMALGLPAAEQSVVAPGAKVEKLAGDFSFTEGPTADAQGNIFFTDQPNNRIHKWSVDGKLSTFMEPSGRANGMYFDAQGQLIACADDKNELWSIDPSSKEKKVLVADFQGKLLNGPNDVWVHPDGGIYFTDPLYPRPYWKRSPAMEQNGQHVYYLAKDHKKLKRVTEDLKQPNGIIGSPDGKKLFVADIGAGKTYSYQINEDGSLSEKKLFCEMGSDGMTLDKEGRIYLTGRGVTVFDANGQKVENIPVPGGWTANVSFGGPDHKTLFITASKGFYSVLMRVAGANPAK